MSNKDLLEQKLQEKILTINTLTSFEEILSVTRSHRLVLENVSLTILDATELPNIYDDKIPNGTLVYLKNINIYLVASNNQWISLDGRVYRNDAPTATLWSWGGQTSDGTNIARSSPVSVIGGFTDWCIISASTHVTAIRTNGSLWVWGLNSSGQLGDNTIIDRSSPVSVIGGFSDWCTVSAGSSHTAAIRTNGTLWSWGSGSNGELGIGVIGNRCSPVSVVGGYCDWCTVSAGNAHTAAIRTNGTLWTWGAAGGGRLGDETIIFRSSPVSVVGGFSDWCTVSAGNAHTAAIRTNGTLWTWGGSSAGRLGHETLIDRSSPVSVVGGFTDWCTVSAGGSHTAAIRTNGTLWTWGCNNYGPLGDGTSNTGRSSPVSVVGGFSDWCTVSAGNNHTAAIRTNGTLWAWGLNTQGPLGIDFAPSNRSSPVSVVGGFTDWCTVSAGSYHTAAMRFYR